jgi:hypothetical protein
MSYYYQGSVSAARPWSSARSDRGKDAYTLTDDDRERLDALLGAALVDAEVRQRLLSGQCASLMADFAIPEETQVWLRGIKTASLTELAQAIAYHS